MKTFLVGLALVGGAMAQMDPCDANYNGLDAAVAPGMDNWKYTWTDSTWSESVRNQCATLADCPNPNMPNGFHETQIAMDNEPPFCLTVEGAQNSNVLVMIEAENPNQRICIKQRANGIALNNVGVLPIHCDVGQITACFPSDSNSNNLNLVAYCDEGCPEGPIPFHYKVAHSMKRTDANIDADSAVNNVDMWCSMLDGEITKVWPSELLPDTPEGFVPNQYLQVQNGAAGFSPSYIGLATVVVLATALNVLN